VLALIDSEARRWGTYVTGCEVVGLVPQAALLDAAEHHLRLEGFRRDQVLEIRLQHPPVSGGLTLGSLLDEIASDRPTPGGGSVAALAGALASALVAMVGRLTVGRKKYAAVQGTMGEAIERAENLRAELTALMRKDSVAFERVMKALQMPQGSPAEAEAREEAVEVATWEATRVPLATAETCAEVGEWAARVAASGNRNAVSDAATAAALARAGVEAALWNVEINLKNLPDGADKQDVRGRIPVLARRSEQALVEARQAFEEATERTA
jgi:glutamate formiminotransferase/formiminotetrahydrofolate cyclodeaminase